MSKINRPPLGLQGLLGSQNFGVNPDDLLREVRGTIDMLPFWGATQLRQKRLSGGRTTTGLIVSQEVIAGETWLLLGVGFDLTTLSAGGPYTLQGYIALNDLNVDLVTPGVHILKAGHISTGLAPGDTYEFGILLPQPIILEPQVKIELYWQQVNLAAADAVNLSVLYYSIPV